MEEILKDLLKDGPLSTSELEDRLLKQMKETLTNCPVIINKVVRTESGRNRRMWAIDDYNGPTVPPDGLCVEHLQNGYPCSKCRVKGICRSLCKE